MEQLLTALQVITAHEEEVNVTDKAIKEVKTEKKKAAVVENPFLLKISHQSHQGTPNDQTENSMMWENMFTSK